MSALNACPLAHLADAARWVAWRMDPDPNPSKPDKKVPYAPAGGGAKSNDASTWGTLAEAHAAAGSLPGACGVGVMLGIHDRYALGGLDLDTCRDPATGTIEAWAADLIARFGTYAEISPSGTGVKLFFAYALDTLPGVLLAMGTDGGKQKYGRTFKRKRDDGAAHPPGMEIYVAGRWFAVTGTPAPGSSEMLATVPADVLGRLIRVDGPAFAKAASPAPALAPAPSSPAALPTPAGDVWPRVVVLADTRPSLKRLLDGDRSSLNDPSRSGVAMALGGHLRRAGFSLADMTAALQEWPDTAAWVAENGPRDLQRIWNAAAPDSAPGAEFPALDPERPRPKIVVRPDNLDMQIGQAEAALIASGEMVYQRGGAVVRSGVVKERTSKGQYRDALRLIDLGEVALLDLMARAAVWMRWDARAKEEMPTRCPVDVPRTYLARGGIGWNLPVLSGVVHAPTLRYEGTVIEVPGYDEQTGLLFDARGVTFPPVPAQPTPEDARAALAVLSGLLAEFPFVAEVDRAVALSMLLTGLVRRSLPTAPLHALTAPTPGTGKSHLADLAALIATGLKAPGVGWVKDNDHENAKVLDAALLGGDAILMLDNIEGELHSPRLNALLSQEEVKVRVLGASREVTCPCNVFVLANGNNLQLPADMTRRTVLCRMDAHMESPEERVFQGDPEAAVIADRGRFVVAGLTVLRAYIVAGCPDKPKPLAGYADWSNSVRGALIWLGCADPVASMAAVRDSDPQRGALQAVLAQWDLCIGPERVSTAQVIAKASVVAEFREALLEVAGAGGAINTRRLGNWLRTHRGKLVGTRHLDTAGVREGTAQWRLRGGARSEASNVTGLRPADREALSQLLQ